MALLVIEGWDNVTDASSLLNKKYPSGVMVTTAGGAGMGSVTGASTRFGTGRAAAWTAGSSLVWTLPSSKTDIYCAMAFKRISNDAGDAVIFGLTDAGTAQCDIRCTSSGQVRATRNGTSLALSAAGVLPLSTWVWVSVWFSIDNVAGRIRVLVEGVNVLDFTGDTQNTVNAFASTVFTVQSGSAVDWQTDDVFLADNTGAAPFNGQLPDMRCVPIAVTGDGDLSDWTASAGADWQCVDEIPSNDDTDYISSSTPGEVSLFTTAAMPSLGSILAVFSVARVKKDDAGVREIRNVLKSGGSTFNGTTRTVLASYADQSSEYYLEDPATTVTWTEAGVNAAQIGVEEIT